MNSAKSKSTLKEVRHDSELKVDEDFEINDNLRIDDKASMGPGQMQIPQKKRTFKATAAGYLLIITFLLNLLLPLNFIYFIYSADTATGETSLSGEILDEDDNPIGNVTVEIIDLNLTTMTDSKGKYSFDKISVGEHEVHFTKDGYRRIIVHKILFSDALLENINEQDNNIDIPGQLQNIYIDPFDGPHIENKIIDNNLTNTISGFISNQSGAPISNIQIEVLNTNLTTQTESDGHYFLTNLTPGIIDLQLTHSENTNKTVHTILFASNVSMELNITYYEDEDKILDEVQGKTGNIQGQILDKSENPVEDARIILNYSASSQPMGSTISNNNGEYFFSDVPVGIYTVSIIASDYVILSQINITVHNASQIILPASELKKIDDPLEIEEEIKNNETYFCIIMLIIFALITLAGAISAFQRKRYGLAFMGALIGMIPMLLIITSYICGASIVSLIGLVLLVFSREEFTFKPAH